MKRVHVVVSGLVQGVGFRYSCAQSAQSRGVTGWVSNTRSGTVEAELEGEAADVDAVVAWCRTGPPHASVDGVDVRELAPTGDPGFTIR